MSATVLTFRWLLTTLIVSMASVGMAEVTRSVPPAKMTPEMLKQASKALPSTTGLSYHLRAEDSAPQFAYTPLDSQLEQTRGLPHGCAQQSGALCYDYRAGNAVYKPMQKLLPAIPGMTPDNLSFRRNKIVARYSFK